MDFKKMGFSNPNMLDEIKAYYANCSYDVYAADVTFVNNLVDAYLAYVKLHDHDGEYETMKGLKRLNKKTFAYLDTYGWVDIADAMWTLTASFDVRDGYAYIYGGHDNGFIRNFMNKHFKKYAYDKNHGCHSFFKIPTWDKNEETWDDYNKMFFAVIEYVICMLAMVLNK